MAQQDATEQVKEVLRQIIKYRFWIAISFAAIFGLVAYFMGAGPVQEAAKKETATIKKAETDVKGYTSPTIPTKDYKPLVEEKTEILTKDVNTAWKTLYDRQAPLLTWPETVQERFRKWGRDWPKDEDASRVQLAQVDYIAAYKDYVDMVYKTFRPFDYETGEGVVAAPSKDLLLRPAVFADEQLPGLGKIWSAQERLWIQRTLLEVVKEVNKNAKDWNTAVIRQIVAMEVGNPNAQDQHSLAKNEVLEEAKTILAPGETEAPPASSAGSVPGMGAGMAGGRGGMMPGMMMGYGGGAKQDNAETVYYVKAGNEQQYRILPVQMTVLIDQDHVQDLLVELENSPMSIEVKDFELQRPTTRVVKPEKGTMAVNGYGEGMMGMSRMMGMMGGRGYGGNMARMQQDMAMMNMQGMGRMGMGGYAPAQGPVRKGTDVRKVDTKKKREEEAKKIGSAKGPSLFDPYFDIVEVSVYGQARFFKPPPAEAAAAPSPGQAPAPPAAVGVAPPDAKGAAPPASAPSSTGGGAPPQTAAAQPQGEATPKPEGSTDGAGKSAAPTNAAAPAPGTGDAAAKPAGTPAEAAKPAAPSPPAPDAPKPANPKS